VRVSTLAGAVAVVAVLAGCTAAPAPHPDALGPVSTEAPTPTASRCAPDASSARLAGKAVLGPRAMIAVDVDTYVDGRIASTTGHTSQITPMHVTWDGSDPGIAVSDLVSADAVIDQLSAAHLFVTEPDPGHPHDELTIDDPGDDTYVLYRTAQTVTVPVTVACEGHTWHGALVGYAVVADGVKECSHVLPKPDATDRLADKACADAGHAAAPRS